MMFFKRILFYVVGFIIVSLGISLTIKANFGVGSWDALNVALSETIGLTVGSWIFIVGIILIFVNSFIEQKKPAYLEIITVAAIGSFVDFWLLFALKGLAPETVLTKVSVLLLGVIVLSVGISIYLQPKLPISPIDHLMISLSERFHLNFLITKSMTEVFAIALAFLLKGPIGIGTLIITLMIGPSIQLLHPFANKLYNSFMKNQPAPPMKREGI